MSPREIIYLALRERSADGSSAGGPSPEENHRKMKRKLLPAHGIVVARLAEQRKKRTKR